MNKGRHKGEKRKEKKICGENEGRNYLRSTCSNRETSAFAEKDVL